MPKVHFCKLGSISVHLKLVLENLKIPMFELFSNQNGYSAFSVSSLIYLRKHSSGLNLSPHTFLSLGGCLAKSAFL